MKLIDLSDRTISSPIETYCAYNEHFGTMDDFIFFEVPVAYVKIIIEELKISTAGYDNIPISVFKHNLILFVLWPGKFTTHCNLFNACQFGFRK